MAKWAVFFEPTPTGYSAHVPDLPGCIGAAATLDEARALMQEAIGLHIAAMREHGEEIPKPTEIVEVLEANG